MRQLLPLVFTAPVVAVLVSSAAVAPAAAQEVTAPYNYQLKVDRTSTPFRDTIGSFRSYPLDKPYSRFTAEEKAALRADYEAMPEADEPPFPDAGMAPIVKALSRAVGQQRLEGDLTIYVTVDATGAATDVTLIRYPDLETAKAVAYVLVNTKYKPALCGGQPCKMQWAFRAKLKPAP
jgi:hypothetical protein